MDTETSFKNGDEIKQIDLPCDSFFRVGVLGVEKITVVMECGQMAGVPWFAIWKTGKIISKYNSVHVASVTL